MHSWWFSLYIYGRRSEQIFGKVLYKSSLLLLRYLFIHTVISLILNLVLNMYVLLDCDVSLAHGLILCFLYLVKCTDLAFLWEKCTIWILLSIIFFVSLLVSKDECLLKEHKDCMHLHTCSICAINSFIWWRNYTCCSLCTFH